MAPPAPCSSPANPSPAASTATNPASPDLDDGDLKTTTDFRDVYAALLAKVLDTDPARILGPGRTVATYL